MAKHVSIIGALWLLAGCDATFTVEQGVLGTEFRIAAMGVRDGVASAITWSGLGPWHEQPPELTWSVDGEVLGEGWAVEVEGGAVLELEATSADGQVLFGEVLIGENTVDPSFTRQAVDLGEDLSIEARGTVEGQTITGSAATGQGVRLGLTGDLDEFEVSWMTVGDDHTLLELDATRADILAEHIEWDDGLVTSRIETSPGTFHHLALLVDGEGSNSWLWLDAAIGVEQSLFGHAGWLLPGEVETSTGLVAITLERAEDGTVVPGDPQPVEDLEDQDPMPCMPEDRSFEWDWLAEGRCPMSEMDGARVVLEVW